MSISPIKRLEYLESINIILRKKIERENNEEHKKYFNQKYNCNVIEIQRIKEEISENK